MSGRRNGKKPGKRMLPFRPRRGCISTRNSSWSAINCGGNSAKRRWRKERPGYPRSMLRPMSGWRNGKYSYLSTKAVTGRPKSFYCLLLFRKSIKLTRVPFCGNKSTGASVYLPGLSRPVWGKTGWPASARIGNMNNQLSLGGNNIRPFRPGGIDRPGRKSTDKKRRG